MFRKASRPHTLNPPQVGATYTTSDKSITAAMEYAAALEEKASAQSKCIIDLDVRVYGQTVLTDTTDYAASAVSTGDNKELTEIRSMMKQLAALVTA